MEKACEIYRNAILSNHFHLTIVLNNIGLIHAKMRDYSNAILNYEKALKIYKESLPSNHENLRVCLTNIGSTYVKMGDHLKALPFNEKAREITNKIVSPNEGEGNLNIPSHISILLKAFII